MARIETDLGYFPGNIPYAEVEQKEFIPYVLMKVDAM
jgi:hypothetical protein